jgi:hypothetical protein
MINTITDMLLYDYCCGIGYHEYLSGDVGYMLARTFSIAALGEEGQQTSIR